MAQVFHRGEARILLHSTSSRHKITGDAFGVADMIGDMIAADAGDSPALNEGSSAGDVSDAPAWEQQKAFTSLSKTIQFVRLTGHVEVGAKEAAGQAAKQQAGRAGFIIAPQVRYKNCRLSAQTVLDPTGDAAYAEVTFRPTRGSWNVVLPDAPPLRTRLAPTEQPLDDWVGIKSVKPLLANQQFKVDLGFLGVSANYPQNRQAHARLSWGNRKWSINFPHNAPPYLQKATGVPSAPWATVAVFQNVGNLDLQSDLEVYVMRVDDRLYLQIGKERYDVLDKTDPKDQNAPIEPQSFEWGQGSVEFALDGVSATFGFALVDYLSTKNLNLAPSGRTVHHTGIPITAEFEYEKGHTLRIANETTTFGHVAGNTGGCPKPVVRITAQPQSVLVTCTLSAEPKYGRHTPFIAAVLGDIPPTTTPVSSEPLDIREACGDLSIESAEPGLLASSQATITLNRNTLKEMSADWQDYTKAFRYAEISLSRQMRDTDSGAITQTPWVPVLDGYTWSPVHDTPGVNDLKGTLVVRDAMVRLQSPSEPIDERFGALDGVFAAKGTNLYGPDAVQYILKTAVSPEMAESLNAGDPFAFLTDKIALLAFDGKTFGVAPFLKPPSSNSFLFPPPFDRYPLDWIMSDVAPLDRAFFCFGYHPAIETETMVPLYGRILNYIKAYGPTPLPLDDAIYDPASPQNAMIARLQSRLRTEKAYNEFSVRSSPPSGGAGQVMPSLFSGYDRTSPDSPYSIEDTWRRRLTLRNKLFDSFPEGIQAIATLMALQFEGLEPDDVSLDLTTGREDIRWGRKVVPRMSKSDAEDGDGDASDASLALDGQELIVKRVSHKLNWGGNGANFTTNLITRRANAFGF